MKKDKLWGGRFEGSNSSLLEEISTSLENDIFFFKEDIQGSIAHCKMLAECKIINNEEKDLIIATLKKIEAEIENKEFVFDKKYEDIHMSIEARLIELIGDTGKKLHTARSRNDQVALDFRLFISNKLKIWQQLLYDLIKTFHKKAKENKELIMAGYTHFQAAQPVLLSHHLLAYMQKFKRDFQRIDDAQKRIRISPLGACAMSGTTYPTNPEIVQKEIGFESFFENSMDAVSDRDFVAEALFISSMIFLHLSSFCEEIIIWANQNFGFINLPDEYSTGSSIMPQKKNPDVAELIRGKTGSIIGNLNAILIMLKSLPLTYNRDMQEDKFPFINSDKQLTLSLKIMSSMLQKITFNQDKMLNSIKKGFINATELADYLVRKGISFRDAHKYSGLAVLFAEKKGINLEDIKIEDYISICPKIKEDVYESLDYKTAILKRISPSSTGYSSVENQLNNWENWIKENERIFD